MTQMHPLMPQAFAAFQAGRDDEARAVCRQVIAQSPNDIGALLVLGAAEGRSGSAQAAVAILERARALAPRHPHILNALGAAYRAAHRIPEAQEALEAAVAADPKHAGAWINLGHVHVSRKDQAAGSVAYARALTLTPGSPTALSGMAQIAELNKEYEKAAEICESLLRANPFDIQANVVWARCRLQLGHPRDAIRTMSAFRKQTNLPASDRLLLAAVSAEAFEAMGDDDGAFVAFQEANDCAVEMSSSSGAVTEDAFSLEALRRLEAFVLAQPKAYWRDRAPQTPCPVFMTGFPRSGTTLLEQILDSHPDVTTLEESNTLADAYQALLTPPKGPERLSSVGSDELAALRTKYWSRVETSLKGAPRRRIFVDKQPLYEVLTPAIALMFPGAKYVYSLRDPRDVILSCFKQRFFGGLTSMEFAKLDSAVAYYCQVMSLMRACRDKIEPVEHIVRYEDLVGDFDGTVGKALAFLDLPWDPSVKDYAATARAKTIRTPSADQVIKPIYTSSVEKWRRYEKHLAPYLDALRPWIEQGGYRF